MDRAEIVQHLKRFKDQIEGDNEIYGLHAAVWEFVRVYIGATNTFYKQISSIDMEKAPYYTSDVLRSQLKGLIGYLNQDLLSGTSPERQAELDVVTDFGTMAQNLLNGPKVHPAAPAMIICKALGFWTLIWRMVRPPWTTPAGSSGAPGRASDSRVARGATSRCRLS